MKIIKWVIGIVLAVFVLLVIAVVVLVNFVNPNDYRNQINQAISDKIHKPFAIKGDISWVFFPSLGFKAQNMTIGDRQAKDLYVELNILEINLQLLPLLHKNIAVNALRVDGAQVLLPADQDDAQATFSAAENNNPANALFALPQLSLKALSIKNANIVKQKSNGAPLWQIKNLSEEATDLSINQTFPEQVDFTFSYPEKNISANINFKTDLRFDMPAATLQLFSPKLRIENSSNGLLNGTLNFTMKKLLVDLLKQNISAEKFSGDFNQLNFSGQTTVNHFLTNPSAQGNIALSTDHLKAVFDTLHIALPKMQSESALSKFSLTTDFQYDNNQLRADPLTVQLDQATFKGSITSADLKNLAVELNLGVPNLNLSDYLTASDPSGASHINLAGSQLNVKLLPPIGEQSWLASTVSGSMKVKKLTYNNEVLSNLELGLDAKNQIFNIIKFHSEIWQGMVDATGVVNLQRSAPQFTLNPQIKNMQIKNIMAIVEPKFNLTGLANMNGTINSAGSSLDAIKQNLTGRLAVRVNSGVLHGVDVSYWLKAAQQVLHQQGLPGAQPSNAQTQFGTLTATLVMNQGVVNNSDLLMVGPTLYVKGQGTVDLPRETINYHLFLAKTNEDTRQAHHDVIPLVITGSFDHPSFGLDMAALTQQVVSKVFDKQKDRLLQKALGGQISQSQVGQQLGDALGKLFH